MMLKAANNQKKKQILEAIAKSDNPHFASNFSQKPFMRIPGYSNPKCRCIYWTSSIGDVTVIVRDGGDNINNWLVQFQCW